MRNPMMIPKMMTNPIPNKFIQQVRIVTDFEI